MIHPICLGLVLTLSMAAGEQLGQVREVPDDWTATELRPLPVAAATASSEAASDDQRYAPRRAVDGHRGTKWVAAVAPSATAPQWITLQLLGAGRQVSTFTLRGEPVDNDGVLDAQVQVLLPAGEFRTVATVRQARSGHWLATFEPVETTAVRLLVTRSGGPSPHTDIYEIGLYGPPLSPEQYLPPSRIGMMQQVLPPGSPPLRPLDLFDRTVPSVWHLHCKNDADQWDVVGLFNFGDRPAERAVDLESLGVPAGGEVAVFEFLEERFLGVHNDRVALTLPPHSCRVLSIRRLAPHPQLIGTNMHLLQGYHELKKLAWDAERQVLSGTYQRMPGLAGRAFYYLPDGYYPRMDFPLGPASARLTHVAGRVWMQEVDFQKSTLDWSIPFQRSSK